MDDVKEPDDCQTMIEVRAGVDSVDRQMVALLVRRFGYMDAAARIKQVRSSVRDDQRKAEVISKVRDAATRGGLDADVIGELYDRLIEASIAYEFQKFDARPD